MNESELRQLDREMAERIMGWHETPPALSYWMGWENEAGVPMIPRRDWHPTSDIGQAMMVVEALRTKGWLITMADLDTEWGVRFCRNDREPDAFAGVGADRLEVAICLAAKATEGAG